MSDTLKNTFFTHFHQLAGAKFVPFAGYKMPVSFAGGIAEHNHVRIAGNAGLFDVSHMGQITLSGDNAMSEFARLVPSNIETLPHNHAKYTVLMNDGGGIIDDCIVTKNPDNTLFIVVNGARKEAVLQHLQTELKTTIITHHTDCGLLALQGQGAAAVLGQYCADIHQLKFMQSGFFKIDGMMLRISRCGYTGEDGFEISVTEQDAEKIYILLTQHNSVQSIGLGARDTLRLEAGLCLYGQDIDMDISPIQAGLNWIISKERTKDNAFIGADILQKQFENGIVKQRVGLLPQTKAPMRQGVELFNELDEKIGYITSGTFSPTLQRPIAMGYVLPEYTAIDTQIFAELRGKKVPVLIAKMPFVPHHYMK
ncbi:MAG: aminomethyltransferase [Alphaproteobacteria bacterium]|jgi:aminomethyltransferase